VIHDLDVLIVGAGPIGLTLACHLRRLGLNVRLIEKRSAPSVHSKAIGLQYRVSEVLARLGIVDRFVAQGGSPTTVNIYAGDERLVQLRFGAPMGISGREAFSRRAILIPQSQTEGILIDYLHELGGAVEWQTELASYRQESEHVLANVQREGVVETIDARWLVSCEGAHSVVRKQANIPFRGKSYPLAFFMADVRMEGSLAHAENHVWLHADGSLAALPLPAPQTWRLFVEVTSQAHQPEHGLTVEQIQQFIAQRAPSIEARIVGEPLWLSDFRINCRMVDRMHEGRVFLAGDAAHIHSPTGGQGITTGMQDAANLAWKLARVSRGAPVSLLDTYDEERLPHAEEVLRETDRTTTLLFAPNRALRWLRDTVVLPVLRNPWFQRRMFGKFSQLHVHYQHSSLSRENRRGWWRRRDVIRAGDRAPDVAFTDTRSREPATLFSLMAGLRPVVLFNGIGNGPQWCERFRLMDIDAYAVGPQSSQADATSPQLIDRHGDFAALYGLRTNFLCLIRPDGHVGLVQVPPDEKHLNDYLTLICAVRDQRDATADAPSGIHQ
jgi:2-polyprenyl-6-methoxyphenol hydroxylase-like FAD-dependent oxidoreductase